MDGTYHLYITKTPEIMTFHVRHNNLKLDALTISIEGDCLEDEDRLFTQGVKFFHKTIHPLGKRFTGLKIESRNNLTIWFRYPQ